MKLQRIGCCVNTDAISSYPNVLGQLEFYHEYENDTEYGVEYQSYKDINKAYQFADKFNEADVKDWKQADNFINQNYELLQ